MLRHMLVVLMQIHQGDNDPEEDSWCPVATQIRCTIKIVEKE
jgi:hypothetical protein